MFVKFWISAVEDRFPSNCECRQFWSGILLPGSKSTGQRNKNCVVRCREIIRFLNVTSETIALDPFSDNFKQAKFKFINN